MSPYFEPREPRHQPEPSADDVVCNCGAANVFRLRACPCFGCQEVLCEHCRPDLPCKDCQRFACPADQVNDGDGDRYRCTGCAAKAKKAAQMGQEVAA